MNYKLFASIIIVGFILHGEATTSCIEDEASVSTQNVIDEQAMKSVDDTEVQKEGTVESNDQESEQAEEAQQIPDSKRMLSTVKNPVEAVFDNDIDGLRKSIEAGSDFNQISERYGKNALHIAVQLGQVDCVKYLIEKGATPHLKALNGQTSFDLVAECRSSVKEPIMDILKSSKWK